MQAQAETYTGQETCPACRNPFPPMVDEMGSQVRCRKCGTIVTMANGEDEGNLEDMASEWISAGVEQVWGEHEAELERSVREQQERLERRQEELDMAKTFVLPSQRPASPVDDKPKKVEYINAPKPISRAAHGVFERSWSMAG